MLDLLGKGAHGTVSVNGALMRVQAAASPAPLSLAVQSGVVNLREFARVYLAPEASSRQHLEMLVDDYLGARDRSTMKRLRDAVGSMLADLGIDVGTRDKFYYRFFAGDGVLPASPAVLADVPADMWAFAGLLAAAEEIARGD